MDQKFFKTYWLLLGILHITAELQPCTMSFDSHLGKVNYEITWKYGEETWSSKRSWGQVNFIY